MEKEFKKPNVVDGDFLYEWELDTIKTILGVIFSACLISFLIIIYINKKTSVYIPGYVHIILLICMIILAIILLIPDKKILARFDHRKYRGIGNYEYSYDEYSKKVYSRDKCMKFPFATDKKDPEREFIFYKKIHDKNIINIIEDEIYPALIELYIKADFNKDTKKLYPVDDIKRIYNVLKSSLDEIAKSKKKKKRKKLIKQFMLDKDEIISYIKNIQKPIDLIYNNLVNIEESNMANKDLEYIKIINELNVDETKMLLNKYK